VHELSLCRAIARTVADRAEGRRVTRVHVRIGHFRQVVPDVLTFSWEALTSGSDLEGAALVVEYVPATVECAGCGAITSLDAPVLVCGDCGSAAVTLLTGEELLLVSFDVVASGEGAEHGSIPPAS
jgi:hydrogenase nickel incorporation protein HypA/HybF